MTPTTVAFRLPRRKGSGARTHFPAVILEDQSEPMILAEPIVVADRLLRFRGSLDFREGRHMLRCGLIAPLVEQPSSEDGGDLGSQFRNRPKRQMKDEDRTGPVMLVMPKGPPGPGA